MSSGVPYDQDQDQAAFMRKVEVAIPINLGSKNIKAAAAKDKPSTYTIPPIAILALGAAMKCGADKYGAFNWRTTDVTASTFIDAINRHFLTWQTGENNDPESHISHLAHIMANCAILLDGMHAGGFVDDRSSCPPIIGNYVTYKFVPK